MWPAPYSTWLPLCQQTIVWEPMTGRDEYGAPQYGPPVTQRGRRVNKMTRVPGKGGDPDALADSVFWILAKWEVGYEDRVYVQGDTPPFPVVLNVTRYPDETGAEYTKVFMGKAQ